MWVPTLATAREVAADAAASIPNRIAAADVLVANGELDIADRLIGAIDAPEGARPMLQRLARASANLRQFDIPQKLAVMGDAIDRLNGPGEIVDIGSGSATGAIVVFTEVTRRLWLSLPVLHQFLAPFGRRILYLKDMRGAMFLGGLRSLGPDYASALAQLKEMLASSERVDVIACSSGGFIGLRAAADLQARRFLGFSIRTDLSRNTPLLLDAHAEGMREQEEHAHMLVDLRPYLLAHDHPEQVALYCSRMNRIDLAHAEHLNGIPRVALKLVESGTHNVVQHLVAEGSFTDVLREHLG